MARNIVGYMVNVGKSISYSAADKVSKELFPNTQEFIQTNGELYNTIYNDIRNYKITYKRAMDAFKRSKVYEAGDLLKKNLFEDIQSGKFYNKQRIENTENEAYIGDIDGGFDDGLSDFGDLDSGWDDFDSFEDTSDDEVETESESNAKAIGMSVARTGEYIVENQKMNTNILYNQNIKNFAAMEKHMVSIGNTLNSLTPITELTKMAAENQQKFYENTGKILNDMLSLMRGMNDKLAKAYPDEKQKKDREKPLRYGDIVMNGMPNLKSYGKNILSNIENEAGALTSMLSMFGEDSWKVLLASPLSFITTGLVNQITPKMLEKNLKNLDKSLSGIFSSMMMKFNKMSNDYENPIMASIGKILGVRNNIKSSPDLNYEKGKIDFNGMHGKALTEVIPTYLRKILSALTGKDEMVYDYKKGTFVNGYQVKQSLQRTKDSYADSATSNMRDAMEKNAEAFTFDNPKDKKDFMKDMKDILREIYRSGELFDVNSKNELQHMDYGVDSKTFAMFKALFKSVDKNLQLTFNNDIMEGRETQNQYMENLAKNNDLLLNVFNGSMLNSAIDRDKKTGKLKERSSEYYKSSPLNVKDNLGNNAFYYLQNMYKELSIIRSNVESPGRRFGNGGNNGFGGNYGGGEGGSYDRPQDYSPERYKTQQVRENGVIKTKYIRRSVNDIYVQDNTVGQLSSIEKAKREEREKERFLKDEKDRMKRAPKDTIFDVSNTDEKDIEKRLNNALQTMKLNQNINDRRRNRTFLERVLEGENIPDKVKKGYDAITEFFTKPMDVVNNMITKVDTRLYQMIYGSKTHDGREIKGFMDLLTFKMESKIAEFSNFMHEKILDPLHEKLKVDKLKEIRDEVLDRMGLTGLGDKIKKFLFGEKDENGNRIEDGIFSRIGDSFKKTFGGIWGTVKESVSTALNPLTSKFKRENRYAALDNMSESEIIEESEKPSKSHDQLQDEYSALFGENLADARYVSRTGRSEKDMKHLYQDNNYGNIEELSNRIAMIKFHLRSNKLTPETKKKLKDKVAKLEAILKEEKKNKTASTRRTRMANKQAANTTVDPLEAILEEEKKLKEEEAALEERGANEFMKTPEQLLAEDKQKRKKLNYLSTKVQTGEGALREEFYRNHGRSASFEDYYADLLNRYQSAYDEVNDGSTIMGRYDRKKEEFQKQREDFERRKQDFLNRKNALTGEEDKSITVNPEDIQVSATALESSQSNGNGFSDESFEGKSISLLEKINDNISVIVNGIKNIRNRSNGRSNVLQFPTVGPDGQAEAALGDVNQEPSEEEAATRFANNLANVITQFMRGNINFFSKGSNELPESQVAVVGKGEAIIPADQLEILKKIIGEAKEGVNKKEEQLSAIGNRSEAKLKAILRNVPDDQLDQYLNAIDEEIYNASGDMGKSKAAALKLLGNNINKNIKDDRTKGDPKSAASGLVGEIFDELGKGVQVTKEALFGNDPDKEKKDFGVVVDDVTKHLNDYLPDAITGAVAGGGISLLTGAIGGPLLGAAVGAGISLAKNSEKVQEWLFGDKETHEGGLLPQEFLGKVQRYLPDLKTYGITGGVAGLLPFMPFGPIGGIMLGGAFAFAKNNKNIQDRLFGENGLLDKDWKGKVRKKLPRLGAGALAGAIIGGPFGILGNAVLGSGIGYLTTTNTFTEIVLGKKDPNTGKWEGGLLSSLQENVIEPLKISAGGFKDRFWNYIDKDILKPLKNAKDPLLKELKLAIRSVADNTKKFLEGMFERTVGIPLKKLIDEKLGKLFDFGKKVGGKLLGGAAAAISAPFKAVGVAGEAAKRKQIKKGQADYMTAAERVQYRKDHATWNFTGGDYVQNFDEALAKLSEESPEKLKDLRSALNEATMSEQQLKNKRKDMQRSLASNLMDHYGSKDTKAIMAMIKHGSQDNIEAAKNRIIKDKNLSAADRINLQRQIDNYSGYLGENMEMTKKYGDINKILKEKFGITGLKNLNRKDVLAYLDKEIKENEGKEPTKQEKETKEFRNELLDKMQELIDVIKGTTKEGNDLKNEEETNFRKEFDSDGEVQRDVNGFKYTIDEDGNRHIDRKDPLTRQLLQERGDKKRAEKEYYANEWHRKRQADLEEAFGTETLGDKVKNAADKGMRKTAQYTGKVGNVVRGTGTLGLLFTKFGLSSIGKTLGLAADGKNILGYDLRNMKKDFKEGFNGETNYQESGANAAGKGAKDVISKLGSSIGAAIGQYQNEKDKKAKETTTDENTGIRRFKLNRQGEQIEDLGDAETLRTTRKEAKEAKEKKTLTSKMLGFFKRQEEDDKDDDGKKKKKGIFGKILAAVTTLGGLFKGAFGGLIGKAGSLLGLGKLGKLGGLGSGALGILTKLGPLGIVAGVAAGGFALANADKLFDFWDNKVAPWITEKAVPWITNTAIPAIGRGIETVVTKIPDMLYSAVTKGIPMLGKTLWNLNKAVAKGLVNGIKNALVGVGKGILRSLLKTLNHIKNAVVYFYSSEKRNAANKQSDAEINQKFGSTNSNTSDNKASKVTNSDGSSVVADDGTDSSYSNDFGDTSFDDAVDSDYSDSDSTTSTREDYNGPTTANTAKVLTRNALTKGATGNLAKIGSKANTILSKGAKAANVILHPFKATANVVKGLAGSDNLTQLTSKTGKVMEFTGNIAEKGGAMFSKVANGIGSKVKGVENLAKDAVATKSGLIGKAAGAASDIAEPILKNIKDFLSKLLTNPTVQKLIGGDKVKKLISKFVPDVIQKISKNLAKNATKLTSKVAAAASSGGLLNIAWAVVDFISGYRNAKEILGITEDPSFGMKIGCGLLKAFNGLFIVLSFIPESTWVDIFVDGILPIFGKEDGELQRMRQEARDNLDKYNQETGQDLTLEEYNDMVEKDKPSVFTKAKDGLKNIAASIGNKVKSAYNWGKDKISAGVNWAKGKAKAALNWVFGNDDETAQDGQGGWNNDYQKLLYPNQKMFKGKGGEPDFDSLEKGTGTLAEIYSQPDIDQLFKDASSKYGVDPDMAKALSMQESGGDPNNYNGAALGLMQIENGGTTDEFIQFGKSNYGADWTAEDRSDPSKAIPFGVYRLGEDLKRYDGDYLKALQAYNFSHYSLDALIKATGDDWWDNRKNVGQYNGTGLSSYGDPEYVEHVLRYYKGQTPTGSGTGTGESSNTSDSSSGDSDDPLSSLASIFGDAVKGLYGLKSGNSNSGTGTSGTVGSGDISGVISSAQAKLGDPYVWGGTGSPLTEDTVNSYRGTDHDISKAPNWKDWIGKPGYDCSGLVQAAYAENGITIGRTTYDQIKDGQAVNPGEQVAGDLMLFGSTGDPHHVGMSLGNGTFIEAPSSGKAVRISPDSSRSDLCAVRRIIDGGDQLNIAQENVSDGDTSGAAGTEGGVGGFTGKGGFADNFFSKQLQGNLTSGFGRRKPIGNIVSANHTGIDIGAQEGKNIPSPVDGVVTRKAGRDSSNGLGNMVVIRDGKGGEHYFGHMKGESNLALGSKVKAGETIGHVGNTGNSTGSHLHYETRVNNVPVDPNKYLGEGGFKAPSRAKELEELKKMESARSKKGMGGFDDNTNSSGSIINALNSIITLLTTMQQDTSNLGSILELINKILDLKAGNSGSTTTTNSQQQSGTERDNTRKQLIEQAKNNPKKDDLVGQLTGLVSRMTQLATE